MDYVRTRNTYEKPGRNFAAGIRKTKKYAWISYVFFWCSRIFQLCGGNRHGLLNFAISKVEYYWILTLSNFSDTDFENHTD